MFDPDILLDNRLANECKIVHPELFLSVPSGTENEVKVLADRYEDCLHIRDAYISKGNRTVDYRSFSFKAKPIVTLNLDTVDPATGKPTMRIARAGYSLRIRGELNPDEDISQLRRIDISVKTEYGTGNVIHLNPQRGEWEAALDTLEPDFDALVEQTRHCKLPLPDFFRNNNISPDEIRVKSIGCCWRREYNHYHRLPTTSYAMVYAQTEDATVFTTPNADAYQALMDIESEAEAKGFWGVGKMDSNAFDNQLIQSVARTHRLMLNASPRLTYNTVTKAARAEAALEHAYRDFCDPVLTKYFNSARMTPTMFALHQDVCPQEVRLKSLGFILGKIRHDLSKRVDGQEYTAFQYG